MKILINNYTFNSTTKQIALTDYTSVDLEAFLLITNVASNIIIYNFADPAKGGTVSGNILTLDYNTASMSNTDNLQIFIDDGLSASTNETIEESNRLLSSIYNRTDSLAVVDANQRQRIAVEVMPTVTVNANSSNVTVVDPSLNSVYTTNNAATFARVFAVAEVWKNMEMARQSYQQCIRANLTF
jgi:hypothetical protein